MEDNTEDKGIQVPGNSYYYEPGPEGVIPNAWYYEAEGHVERIHESDFVQQRGLDPLEITPRFHPDTGVQIEEWRYDQAVEEMEAMTRDRIKKTEES